MLIPDDDLPRQEIGPGPGAGLSESANAQELGGNIGQASEVAAEVATRENFNANAQRKQDWQKQQEVQKQADGIAAQDAANKVDAWHQAALYGTPAQSFSGSRGARGFGDDGSAPPPPSPGILNQQTGANAPAIAQKALGDFDKQAGQARAELNNDQQKQFFDHMTAIQREHMQAHLDEYVGKQLHLHAANVQDNTVDLSMNAITNNPADYPAQVAKMQASTQSFGKFMGWDQPTMDKNVGAVASQAYLATVRAFNDQGNPQAAQAVLDAHRSDITDPKALEEADKATKAGVLADTAQTLIGARLKVADDTAPGGSRFTTKDEFLASLDDDKELQAQPDLLTKVRAGGLQQIAQHEAIENDRHNTVFQGAMSALDKGTPVTDPAWNANVESLPKPLQDAVWEHADRLTNEHIKAVATDRQHANYAELFDTSVERPKVLRNMTFAQFSAKYGNGALSPENFDRGLQIWKDAGGGRPHAATAPTNPDPAAPIPSEWADVAQSAKQAGLSDVQTGKFVATVQTLVDRAETAKGGKPVTPEEREKIKSDALANTVFVPTPGGFQPTPNEPWGQETNVLGIHNATTPVAQRIPIGALTDDDLARLPAKRATAIREQLRPPGTLSADEFRRAAQGAAIGGK